MIISVCIVVPVFNQSYYTNKFLKSVEDLKIDHSIIDSISVIVIDNNSTDNTIEVVERFVKPSSEENNYVYLQYIKLDENLGYGRAVTEGLKRVKEYEWWNNPDIVICNNDMELDSECINELVRTAYKYEDCGIVGGKLLFPDGRIQHAGGFLNSLGCGQHLRGGSLDVAEGIPEDREKEVEYVTGALFYIKNAVRQMFPYFDDRYFMYMEEVDYCYQIREYGWKTYYTPKAKAIHYEGVTGKAVLKGGIDEVKKQYSDVSQVKFYQKQDELYKQKLEEIEDNESGGVLITGKIYGEWSFSGVLRNLSKGLKRSGIDVSIAPEEYHNIQSMADWEIKEMINKPNDYWNRHIIRSCEGDHMYLMPPGIQRIAHTTGESNIVNGRWIEQLNNTDKVMTTSSFFKEVMENGGVKTPIYILPNSVDTDLYKPDVKRLKLNQARSFKFFSVFHFGLRKGPEILIKAFVEEFSEKEDVCLVIHSLSMEHVIQYQMNTTVSKWIESLSNRKDRAPILVTTSYFPDELMPHFLSNFDCFVLPTRGEGFGLPIIEAGALGKPSIVTGYSGVMDFMDPSVGWTIDYKLTDIPLQYLPYFKNYIGGKWAEPSVDHLRVLMRYAFEHQDEVKEKGIKARKKALNYSINNIGKTGKDIIFS